MSSYYVIGAGGVGSWLAESLVRLFEPRQVCVVDGDTLEKKNMDRQLYAESDIGKNKAVALADRLKCRSRDRYYASGELRIYPDDWLLCCADNHRARKEILEDCDRVGCRAILAANETHSSEAYYYRKDWRSSHRDPRVYYPQILTDTTGDPRAAAIGCTGEAQRANRQLVSANFMAAALAQHLLVFWAIEWPKIDSQDSLLAMMPYRYNCNLTALEYQRVG